MSQDGWSIGHPPRRSSSAERPRIVPHVCRVRGPHGAKNHRKEHDEPDPYGLQGLLTSEHTARISGKTIRNDVHWMTCPTTYTDSPCPCEGCRAYRAENDGRNPTRSRTGRHCCRSRAPHQCRHGAITNLLDEDWDIETIARVVGIPRQRPSGRCDRADEKVVRDAKSWLDD